MSAPNMRVTNSQILHSNLLPNTLHLNSNTLTQTIDLSYKSLEFLISSYTANLINLCSLLFSNNVLILYTVAITVCNYPPEVSSNLLLFLLLL